MAAAAFATIAAQAVVGFGKNEQPVFVVVIFGVEGGLLVGCRAIHGFNFGIITP